MGDLISREALLNMRMVKYDESGCGMTMNAVAVEAIEALPAVDAEPVRHEHWELVDEQEFADGDIEIEEKCSGCGRHVYRYNTQPKDMFCPTCGAKMDKEE